MTQMNADEKRMNADKAQELPFEKGAGEGSPPAFRQPPFEKGGQGGFGSVVASNQNPPQSSLVKGQQRNPPQSPFVKGQQRNPPQSPFVKGGSAIAGYPNIRKINRRSSAFHLRSSALGLLLLAATTATAQDFKPEVWVNPGIYSRHFDRGLNYREKNWGFGVEARVAPEHSAMAGSFINSERTRTRYVAWHWRPWSWDVAGAKVSAGLIAGAFDGYPRYKNGKWFPAAMPVMSVEAGRVGVNFSVLPDIPDRMSGAVAVQVKLKVW